MASADEYVYLPMHGFVESFNISVCAALCLYNVSSRLRASALPWQLKDTEREEIWLSWLRSTIKSAPALERRFLESNALAPSNLSD